MFSSEQKEALKKIDVNISSFFAKDDENFMIYQGFASLYFSEKVYEYVNSTSAKDFLSFKGFEFFEVERRLICKENVHMLKKIENYPPINILSDKGWDGDFKKAIKNHVDFHLRSIESKEKEYAAHILSLEKVYAHFRFPKKSEKLNTGHKYALQVHFGTLNFFNDFITLEKYEKSNIWNLFYTINIPEKIHSSEEEFLKNNNIKGEGKQFLCDLSSENYKKIHLFKNIFPGCVEHVWGLIKPDEGFYEAFRKHFKNATECWAENVKWLSEEKEKYIAVQKVFDF